MQVNDPFESIFGPFCKCSVFGCSPSGSCRLTALCRRRVPEDYRRVDGGCQRWHLLDATKCPSVKREKFFLSVSRFLWSQIFHLQTLCWSHAGVETLALMTICTIHLNTIWQRTVEIWRNLFRSKANCGGIHLKISNTRIKERQEDR